MTGFTDMRFTAAPNFGEPLSHIVVNGLLQSHRRGKWQKDERRTETNRVAYRAKLVRGENVLILGATGVTGKLAVKIAKLLGAARVVAAGRNQESLDSLHDLGADATISLILPETELSEAFSQEAGQAGFQVVIDYVWGRPAGAFLAAITRKEFAAIKSEVASFRLGRALRRRSRFQQPCYAVRR